MRTFILTLVVRRLTFYDGNCTLCGQLQTDFFKDYPPPSGDAPPATSGGADGGDEGAAQGFVLGDSVDIKDEGANGVEAEENEDGEIGGPPAEDSVPECEAVTEWRRAFAKRLEEKVANERRVKVERAVKAKETLGMMHAKWETNCKDSAEDNKKKEREFIRDRDGLIARMSKPGEPPAWSVIPELVDMTGKYKEGARDTSRMRQVLMRMKTY